MESSVQYIMQFESSVRVLIRDINTSKKLLQTQYPKMVKCTGAWKNFFYVQGAIKSM